MAKRSLKRNIIIASLIVVASFITIGVSTYVIKLDTFNSITNSNDNPIDYDDLVEVKIGYKWYTDYSETKEDPTQVGNGTYGTFTYANGEFSNISYVSISDVTSYNTINNFYKDYSGAIADLNSDTISTYTFTSIKSDPNLGINKDTSLITIQCKDREPIKVTTSTSCGSTTYTYSGSYFVYKEEVTKSFTSESNSDFEDSSSIETFYVPKNSILQDNIINAYTDNIYDNKTYSFNKFVKVDDNDIETDFDWKNTPITEPINLYAVYNTSSTTDPIYSSITKTINDASNNSNGDTLKIYAGAGDMNYNVASDLTYFSLDKSFSLGDKNTITNIAEGDTVNFCLNNGEVSIINNTERNTIVEPLNSNVHFLQYKIILQNDLNVDGTLTIGSKYGSNHNSSKNGNISGEYVWLDLNGHNINISHTGEFTCYGLVTNSKKDGQINVEGGTLKSLMVVNDYKGGSSTKEIVDDKQFPFVIFHIPYLRCKTIIKCAKYLDSENNYAYEWGKMIGICNIRSTSYTSPSDSVVNFVGNYDSNDSFFGIKRPTSESEYNPNACIELTVEKNKLIEKDIENVNTSTSEYYASNEYKSDIDYRMIWSFKNIDFYLVPITLSFSGATVKLEEYTFPIPSFFDIKIENSSLFFMQKIQLLPGASIIANEKSKLIFDFDSSNSLLVANLSINEKPVKYYSNDNSYFRDRTFKYFYVGDGDSVLDPDKWNYNTSISHGGDLWNSKYFWKYYDEAICINYGKTLFRKNNSIDQAYLITGKYNFNEANVGIIDENGNEIYDFESTNGSTIFEKIANNNTYVNTVGFSNIPYMGDSMSNTKVYALPLISYGYAYGVIDNQYIKGLWDENTYTIKTSNNDKYFVSFSYMTEETESGREAEKDYIKKDAFLVKFDDINIAQQTISSGENTYILFNGVYFPVVSDNFLQDSTSARINAFRISSNKSKYAFYITDGNTLTTNDMSNLEVSFSNGYWHI